MSDSQKELLEYLETEGYKNLRVLEDGTIVGTYRMLFTYATIIGLDRYSYDSRVCWNTEAEAVRWAKEIRTIDDEPPPGYTARK